MGAAYTFVNQPMGVTSKAGKPAAWDKLVAHRKTLRRDLCPTIALVNLFLFSFTPSAIGQMMFGALGQ